MFASPAIESPEMTATARGRNSPSSSVRAARATNRPLSVIEEKKSGPSPPPPGEDSFTATEISTGTDASTSIPAWLRRRRRISRSSERSSRVENLRPMTDRVTAPAPVSAADIEALTGESHEHVLERRRADPEPHHRDALVHTGGHHLLGCDVAEAPRGGVPAHDHLAEPELPHDGGGHLGLVGLDRGQRFGARPHLRARPLGHQPADVHHPEVAAHLLHLG